MRYSTDERNLSVEERAWLNKLLESDFPGRDILKQQASTVSVKSYCGCGCRTIDLTTNPAAPKFPYALRIPVEMIVPFAAGIPIMMYLHIENGYLSELEVFRADSSSLERVNFKTDEAIVTINSID